METGKGLSVKSQLGGSYSQSRAGKFMGEGSYNVLKGSTVAYGEATNKTGYNYKWENIVTYHNTFNKDHDLTVTGVLPGITIRVKNIMSMVKTRRPMICCGMHCRMLIIRN